MVAATMIEVAVAPSKVGAAFGTGTLYSKGSKGNKSNDFFVGSSEPSRQGELSPKLGKKMVSSGPSEPRVVTLLVSAVAESIKLSKISFLTTVSRVGVQ